MTENNAASHTPGPWSIEPLQQTEGADMAIMSPANGWIVAIIQHDPAIQDEEFPDCESVKWSDQDLANARLLTTAPELLEALEWIAANYENGHLNHVDFRVKAKHLADAAIAKARGE